MAIDAGLKTVEATFLEPYNFPILDPFSCRLYASGGRPRICERFMKRLQLLGHAFFAEEEGATMIEYGLLAALIALVVAAAAFTLGGSLGDRFNDVNNCVAAGETSC